MPEQIVAACVLLPMLSKNGLKLESFQYISAGKNFCNANQPVNLLWRIHFDLVNRSTEGAIFTICKNQELCFITTLNKGVDKLKVKYTKTAWTLIYSMYNYYYYYSNILLQKIQLILFNNNVPFQQCIYTWPTAVDYVSRFTSPRIFIVYKNSTKWKIRCCTTTFDANFWQPSKFR